MDAQFLWALAGAQGFPRKLPGVCGAGVLESSAPQDAVLAVNNCQLNGTESSMSILALFFKPEQAVFLFVITAIIFFFVAKSNLECQCPSCQVVHSQK